jgi:hypothetical protein
MQAACDEAGKVVKRQKLCAAKSDELLDKLLSFLTATRAQVACTNTSALADLARQLDKLGVVKELNTCTKDLHSSVGKLSKVGSMYSCVLPQPITSASPDSCWYHLYPGSR